MGLQLASGECGERRQTGRLGAVCAFLVSAGFESVGEMEQMIQKRMRAGWVSLDDLGAVQPIVCAQCACGGAENLLRAAGSGCIWCAHRLKETQIGRRAPGT